ncbi:hypothetical protein [Haloferax profundi]|uniref:Uncharacterized protein n=1 Tax=Haloferax profundi TaxID=1544718 RepID=A0A0W1S2F4_9EURY|nr:hypothetical protein [Haloferax profundi]KTG20109.1 hypothetical protein AUR66_17670 [Haloferax profundi]
MSNSSSTTETPTGQRTFYGEPQHEDSHVNDRDIFCADESRDDERGLFTQTSHYLATTDEDFAHSTGTQHTVRVA